MPCDNRADDLSHYAMPNFSIFWNKKWNDDVAGVKQSPEEERTKEEEEQRQKESRETRT